MIDVANSLDETRRVPFAMRSALDRTRVEPHTGVKL